MTGIATIDLTREYHTGEVVDRSTVAVDDKWRPRRSIAGVVNRVDQELEIDRLLPQPVGARRRGRECFALTYIGRGRIVANGTNLHIAVSAAAVLGEQAVAYIAFAAVDDGRRTTGVPPLALP